MNGALQDRLAGAVVRTAGWAALVALLGILWILGKNALTAFREIGLSELFGSAVWLPNGYEANRFGILSMIGSSLFVTLASMAIAIPIGIGTAAFLAEVAPRWLREVLKPAIELLAAIPSVVVGFLGLTIVSPAIAWVLGSSHGLNAANGAVLLALMSLPTVVTLSEDAILAVPREWREGSFALGAGRFDTLVRVVIPGARSGIVAAVMLGFGRALGETMTVLMATGNALAFPTGFTSSVRTLTATIAIEMGEASKGSVHYHALFAVALVLLISSLVFSSIADRYGRESPGAR